ncbi:flippase [Ligilactobacillus agilis]|uniref:flippase n=1 Tax=Ligilactobacillus agilis TaxID=1601 RepID=UPI00067ED664|nr:flippase [Ligilactobacillus agilis]
MDKKFKIHSVKYNFIMNVILKTSTFIFPLITFPYVSRVLGPGPNGDISFATSIISYFSLLAGMGIPSYGIRKCAEQRNDPIRLSKNIQELLILNLIFTVISYFLLVILVLLVPKFKSNEVLIYITSLTIIFNTIGVDWVYQAIEQYDYITVRNIAFKIMAILLMFMFVHKPSDYLVYAGITVIGNVGSNILNILRLPHYVTFSKPKSYDLMVHMQPVIMLFLYNATTTIFTNLDQVMLGLMSTSKEVGYYAATVKIKNILTSVITALGAVMLPRVAYYLGNKEHTKFINLIKKSFDFIFISSIPLAFYFIIESNQIIRFLAGPEYKNAVIILQFIAPSIVFIGLSSVTAWQLLIPLKMEKYTVLGAVVGAIINLILNIILIPLVGGVGAAFATTIAELSVLVTHIIVLRDLIIREKLINLIEFRNTFIASVLAMFVLIIFNKYIVVASSLISCILSAIVYFAIYIGVLFLVRDSIVLEYSKSIFRRLR